VHILCGKNNWWHFFAAHGWVPFSAGASVAYVYIHVFPDISLLQQQFSGVPGHHYNGQFFNQPLYLTALAGICLPYLLQYADLLAYKPASYCRAYKVAFLCRRYLDAPDHDIFYPALNYLVPAYPVSRVSRFQPMQLNITVD
jgi:hypothetical protein